MRYEDVKNEIVLLEESIRLHGNTARDLLLKQGALIADAALKVPGLDGREPLDVVADECGLSRKAAAQRATCARIITPKFRQTLEDYSDIYLAYGSVVTILQGPDPEGHLKQVLESARARGATRVNRDEIRRVRGMRTGTVGTPAATAERLHRDVKFGKAVVDALAKVPEPPPGSLEPAWQRKIDSAVVLLYSALETARSYAREGKHDEARRIAEYVSNELALVMAKHIDWNAPVTA